MVGMDHDQLAAHFQADMKSAVDRMRSEIGYHPTVFIRMLAQYGAVGAARRLLASPTAQYGFEKLFEHHKLAESMEAFVVLPWYQPLFTWEELMVAEDRLSLVDFDVAAHRTTTPPPAWAVEGQA